MSATNLFNLYSLTLTPPTLINAIVYGSFSGKKKSEVVVAKGHIIELLTPDETGGTQICSQEVFGVVRSLSNFKLPGASQDYLVVGSDSGKIVVLLYNESDNTFHAIHQETYGKSGCRRVTPGQYLAADPQGRAIMIGAVEKQKMVYVMNRDSGSNLTISSPLECHKSSTIVFDLIGLEVGFDNPIFAALELSYEEADEDPSGEAAAEAMKYLTYYQLDLGLNHVVRKWSEETMRTANLLVAVPGAEMNGPGGVLVCSESWVLYKHEGHDDIKTPLPRRTGIPMDKGLLIISKATFSKKGYFFFLLQSEYGDLYKVTVEHSGETVSNVRVRYFDTINVAIGMAITKDGFLYCASEFGDHCVYKFSSLGDDDVTYIESVSITGEGEIEVSVFTPQELVHLELVGVNESSAPMTDMVVRDLIGEDKPQIYTLCGRGPNSSLKTYRHGLGINEVAEAQLPGVPANIFTVKSSSDQEFDNYIVVSFVNATTVLSVGESVEEAKDSGFLHDSPTIATALMDDESIVQVHNLGIRQIKDKRVSQWQTPGKKVITHAAVNRRQVSISLGGGEIINFELNDHGILEEMEKKEIGAEVSSLTLGEVPENRRRCRFLAVGCWDNAIRIFSLDPDDYMTQLSMQALPVATFSAVMVTQGSSLYLNVGLMNGVLLRTSVDQSSGVLSDTRSRFLGARPVKLRNVFLNGQSCIIALSDKPYVVYTHVNKWILAPLSCEALDTCSALTTEICPDGLVGTHGNTLKMIYVPKLGDAFNTSSVPLPLTPRKMAIHNANKIIAVICSDHNTYSSEEKSTVIKGLINDGLLEPPADEDTYANFQPIPGEVGKWASVLALVDMSNNSIIEMAEFDDNEAAVSVAVCEFRDRGGEEFLVVGTGKNINLLNRTSNGGFLYVYRLLDGRALQLMHKTPVDDIPYALCAFKGRVLVGSGKALCIYELGKLKLLRKCQNNLFANFIQSIQVMGDRIYVGDSSESFFFCKYNKQHNTINVYADDVLPRFLTATELLDFDTMAGADKFGSIFISRLPADISDDFTNQADRLIWDAAAMNGAPNKLDSIMNVFIGDIVTSLKKATLNPRGGSSAIIYSTISGSLGAMMPFTLREDVDFFSHLEMYMRNENLSLVGRDNLAYRSFYAPTKSIIDGDLCELYTTLPAEKQKQIAKEMERSVSEILKKLEDARSKIL